MQMTPEMFAKYRDNPQGMDSEVRKHFNISEKSYYVVAMYPEKVAGRVTIERERIVTSKKISKSDSTAA